VRVKQAIKQINHNALTTICLYDTDRHHLYDNYIIDTISETLTDAQIVFPSNVMVAHHAVIINISVDFRKSFPKLNKEQKLLCLSKINGINWYCAQGLKVQERHWK